MKWKWSYIKDKVIKHSKELHKSKFFWLSVLYYIVVFIIYKIY